MTKKELHYYNSVLNKVDTDKIMFMDVLRQMIETIVTQDEEITDLRQKLERIEQQHRRKPRLFGR